MTKTITTDELVDIFDEPNTILVDFRPIAAYNGWRLRGETRGGHLPGAVACPLKWTGTLNDEELSKLLANKGVTRDKRVILYSYSEEETQAAANRLADLVFGDLRAYLAGYMSWADDPQLPLERLPRFHKLVHPAWLDELIHGGQPEQFDGGDFKLFHISYELEEEYLLGHIPGAVHLNTLDLESPQTWNRRPPDELRRTLLEHGIRHDQTIVIYGRETNPDMSQDQPGRRAGQIAATRAAAILMYAGVKDVRLLDGGLDAWLAAGLPLETGRIDPIPVDDFGVSIPNQPDLIIDLEDAKRYLADQEGSALVSIRSWKEFVGEVSGYHYIQPSGRIAGAVWGNCGTDAYHMQHYRNLDNTMRAYPEIEANWRTADITANKKVAFYCGTGWRASETLFYAHLLGWDQVAVYDGGWYEWSADSNNPIETGEPAV